VLFAVGLDPANPSNSTFNYTVRPFVAGVQFASSDATTITYSSASRITTNSAIMTAAQISAFTYDWKIVTSSGAAYGS
jgi:hypothetical protein